MTVYDVYEKEKGIVPVRFHPSILIFGDEDWNFKLKDLDRFGEEELLNNPSAFNHEVDEDKKSILDDVVVHHYLKVTEVHYHPAGRWDKI